MPKISALPIANSATTGDLLVLDQANVTKRIDFNVLQSAIANAGVVQNLINQGVAIALVGSNPVFTTLRTLGISTFGSSITISGGETLGGVQTFQSGVNYIPLGAVGDDIADDNAALQALLNRGGKIVLGGGKTYRNAAANLTLVANTELWIERGTTLHLDTTRLSAINVNDVQIHNHGVIKSTNLNTTDALPSGWQGRGIVEMGGTLASPAQRVGIYGPGLVMGDFVGTPGTGPVVTVNDRRRGIFFQNVQIARAQNNEVSGIIAEGIAYNSGQTNTLDFDIEIIKNKVHDSNHDAISPFAFSPVTFLTEGNVAWNCLNGIEASIGTHRGNFMFNMVGSGYGMGGSGNNDSFAPLIWDSNVGFNNGTNDFDLEGNVGAPSGVLVITNNKSYGAAGFAFVVFWARTAIITNNFAYGWGRTSVGSAFGWANNTLTMLDGNTLSAEGPFSNGGYNGGGTTVWGVNHFSSVVTPFTAAFPSLSLSGSLFAPQPSGVQQTSVALYMGSGLPSNAFGQNNQFYLRGDGGLGSTIFVKRLGSWTVA